MTPPDSSMIRSEPRAIFDPDGGYTVIAGDDPGDGSSAFHVPAWVGAAIRSHVAWAKRNANTPAAPPELQDLIEKARDWRYSDEWIGNVFRATISGRGGGAEAERRAEAQFQLRNEEEDQL